MLDFDREVMIFRPIMEKIAIGYLGNYDDAQDVVQKVLIKLWNKKDDIYSGDDMIAFVSTVVKNQCIDELRKTRCEQLDENILTTMEQKPSLMDNLIETLEGTDRSIIIMKYEEGLTFKEIGEALSKDEDSVRHRHNKIIKRLRGSVLCLENRVDSRGV